MTRHVLIAIVVLAGCKERGTVSVPRVLPCGGIEPAQFAAYLKRGVDCAAFACGLSAFTCQEPNCVPGCEMNGYCSIDELDGLTIDPPTDGDYALLITYRYPGAATDQGLVCYQIHVDADGTQSLAVDQEEAQQCCM